LLFSGRFDLFHIALGLFSSAIVIFISGDLLYTHRKPIQLIRLWLAIGAYIPWLLYQVFIANLHVLYLTLHPRMHDLIDPHIIEFDSRLKSDYARTTFANSITLTPGTIAVAVNALGQFAVHCIDKRSGQALPGIMEKKIASIFGE
jgi:multicomponent Na+:H+ antiporter subunit E